VRKEKNEAGSAGVEEEKRRGSGPGKGKKNWAGRELSPGGLGKRNYVLLLLFSKLLPNAN
jgi:hypothetical protein